MGATAIITGVLAAASAAASTEMKMKQNKKQQKLMKEGEAKRAALVSRQAWVSSKHGTKSTGQSLLGGQPALGA